MKKTYVKIYTGTTLKGVFIDFKFNSITKSINGGVGELSITIPRKFDFFEEDDVIAFNNVVEVWVYDIDSPNGLKIYSGYIAEYIPTAGREESIELRILGNVAKLSLDILKNGTTIKLSYSGQDPSTILKDIIDKYRAVNPSTLINYGAGTTTISNTGKSEGISFDTDTYLNAIEEVRKLADADWYWYMDVDSLIYFKAIPTTPTHLFVYKDHIQEITFNKSIIQMRNGLIFWNGLPSADPEYVSKFYSDATSITKYGRQVDVKKDGRFKATTGSADEYGNRFLDTFKDPINTVKLKIADNGGSIRGYDIESIQPGQTCKVLNIKPNNALGGNMLITSVVYYLDYAEVTLADANAYTERNILELKQAIQEEAYVNDGPTTYT